MSGSNLFFDTNAIIYLLKGEPRFSGVNLVDSNISISVISVMEYLAYPNLTITERQQFEQFCEEINVVNLDLNSGNGLIEKTVELRKKYKIKLPDAIILASAIIMKSFLITADSELLKISEIKIIPV